VVEPAEADRYILPRTFPYATISGSTVRDVDLSGVERSGTVRLSTTEDPVPAVLVEATLVGDVAFRRARTTTDGIGAGG